MKKNVSVTLILFSLCLLFSSCAFLQYDSNSIDELFFESEPTESYYGEAEATSVPSYDYDPMFIRNNLLGEIEKKLYDVVYTSMTKHETTITFQTINYTFSSVTELKNSLSNVVYAVFYDNPDIFWYDNSFNYLYDENLNITDVQVSLNMIFDENTRNKMLNEIESKAEVIINKISNMSEYEKSKYVYTYIAQNTNYQESDNMHNIYGVLVDGNAVCEGYAKTYCYIMKKCGIDCAVVTGISDNVEHAWNIVKINNNYYYVDPTWGDPILDSNSQMDKKTNVDYSYLHVNSDDISSTHFLDEFFYNLPKVTATMDNYYVREGLYFINYNKNEFSRELYNALLQKNYSKDDTIEIKFRNINDVEKAKKYIDNNLFSLCDGLDNEIYKYLISCSDSGTIKLILSYR